MTIRDFLGQTNSSIDTTINIVQFRNKPNSLRQILNTILTPSFKDILKEALDSIKDQIILTGNFADFQTFLIEGLFGVGKSHFLSVLNTLFDYTIPQDVRDHLWDVVRETFEEVYSELKDKKFLIVPLALHGSRQADLIDIIFREIEKIILDRFEIEVNLSSPSKYINFYRQCAPGIKSDIEDKISSEFEDMDLVRFNDLDENEDKYFYRKAEIIRKCMENLGIKIDDSYKISDSVEEFIQIVLNESFQQLNKQVINRDEIGFDGIILLIDEFSEYLKAQKESEVDKMGRKRTLASLQIQYLAEHIKGKDFFIFITAQEAYLILDPLYEKQVGPGGRLKKTRLDHYHFVEIFNQVLIPDKGNNRRSIESIFPTLNTQYFGDSQYSIYKKNEPKTIDMNMFYECYPFHPMTMDILIGNVFKFSTQTRAGLSYASKYIELSLGHENEELITPDTLFDYFKKEFNRKDTSKYTYIYDLLDKIQYDTEEFTDSEKDVLSKVLKYIYLCNNPVYAIDCIIDLLIDYEDDEELEELLNQLVSFAHKNFQYSFLRKILDSDNKQKYYLQVKGTYDIEDMIHILSEMINEVELYEFYVDKRYNMKLADYQVEKIKLSGKEWIYLNYFIRFEDFNNVLREVVNNIETLPRWTTKGIEFYDLFVFRNLPFREEYNNLTEDSINAQFHEFEVNHPKLGGRLLFLQTRPFSELLVSDIKRCLAFDLLKNRFGSQDLNWHGDGPIQNNVLVGNHELLTRLNDFYNQNIQESGADILNELSNRQREYSLESGTPTDHKIREHITENLTIINSSENVDIDDRAENDILIESMEIIIDRYYPDFPDFTANVENTRYINIILGELDKDQRTFELTAREVTQAKGTAIINIGVLLGIFSQLETLPTRNILFKIGLPDNNLFYIEVMQNIPMEEDVDNGVVEMKSLSKICEFLYTKFGFSLKISKIFLATLLNQDKIKITNRYRTITYNNSQVKKVFEGNDRYFNTLHVFKTNRLNPDEIRWLFSFFNGLFEEEEEYEEEFRLEINNLDEVDDVKSSKQQRLKELLETYDLDETDNLFEEFEDLINFLRRDQEEN